MTNTSFRAAGFALAFALAAGGCPHNADFPALSVSVSVDITADGSKTAGTTALTLKFDQPIAVLSKDDITLTDDGGTGIQKNGLSAEGVYKLAVSGITENGEVTVTVSKAGYAFKGSPKKVQVYAPPTEPPVEVTFRSLTANGSATETTTALTLAFSKAVTELSADDITLESGGTGIKKGALTLLEAAPYDTSAVYTLSVNGITADGEVAVTVSKAGYAFEPKSQSVLVFCPPTERPSAEVRFQFLTANGSATETTTALTLAFSEAIEWLSADDITLESGGTGIQKGALTAHAADSFSEGVYALAVSGITKDGEVTVKAAKAGYAFAPPALTAKVRYVPAPSVAVRFQSLTADGGDAAGTTKLTLAFDKAIEGLSMEDITLKDPEGTGIVLSAQQFIAENGAYTLAVSSVGKSGHIVLKAAKAGYAFSPESQSARVYAPPAAAAFQSLTANGSATETTTELTLKFSKAVPGLSAANIVLEDPDGTGIRKGELSAPAAGADGTAAYTLAVSDIWRNGSAAVRVQKAGHAFAPSSRAVQVHASPDAITFLSLEANGGGAVPTTELTLKFSRDVRGLQGLSADDITLEDPDGTGIRKGAFTPTAISPDRTTYTCTLAVSGVWRGGSVTVRVQKAGYSFTPPSRTVQVRNVSVIEFQSFAARAWEAGERQIGGVMKLDLQFSHAVSGLSADDIALEDPDGTGIRKGELADAGGGAYVLTALGATHSGSVTVTVAKTGYTFTPTSLTAAFSVMPETVEVYSVRAVWQADGGMALRIEVSGKPELQAENITFYDPDGTGIRGGALTWSDFEHAFMLAVSGVARDGTVRVMLRNPYYAFTPDTLRVAVPPPPIATVTFQSLEADSGGTATTALTLKFSQAVPGLSASNIRLEDPDGTGIQKGALTDRGGGEYRLAVSGVARSGPVTATVSKAGYVFKPPSHTAQALSHASPSVWFQSLSASVLAADGMTELTLVFDKPVAGLTAADITVVNPYSVTHSPLKGAVRANGRTAKGGFSYTLTVLGVFNGTLTAKAAKGGYTFIPAEQTAPVRTPISAARFLSLTQDGTPGTGTTRLWATFDRALPMDTLDGVWPLADSPFYLNWDTGQEAIRVGDTFTYELRVTEPITERGQRGIKLHSWLFTITPDERTTETYPIPPSLPPAAAVRFESLAADGKEAADTTTLTLRFNRDIAGLSAADITLMDGYGTGIQKGALARTGSGTYALAVSGIRKGGFVMARVQKAGYRFEYVAHTGHIDCRTAWVYKAE